MSSEPVRDVSIVASSTGAAKAVIEKLLTTKIASSSAKIFFKFRVHPFVS